MKNHVVAVAAFLLLSALPAGCGSDSTVVTLTGGSYRVRVDTVAASMELSGASGVLLSFPAAAIQLGVVTKLDEDANYDPYPMVRGDAPWPASLAWLPVKSITKVSAGEKSAEFLMKFDRSKVVTAKITVSGSGSFKVELIPNAKTGSPIAYFRLAPQIDPNEGLYGLGAYLDDVNNRGKMRAMQMEAGDLESANIEAHVPVPLLIGTRGWGLFVELVHPGIWDVASKKADQIDAMFATALPLITQFNFHLFAADKPLDITKLYYDVTGYPLLPARWALGPLFWRDENRDQAEVEDDAKIMRDLDLADSAIWIDRPYATAVNTFDFNPPQFPAPQNMIDRLHALGYRVALWSTPYLEAATGELLTYAQQQGFYPPTHGILLNKWGTPIDFTNQAAFDWWQGLIRRYTDMGIEGFKMDYGEDVVPGIMGMRNVWEFADGRDERTMHYYYNLLYHKVYAQTLPKEGGFLLCRAGKWGDQAYASVIWPGDLDADFWLNGEEVVNKSGEQLKAVGGLPASMIYGLTLGPSGLPFYGSDTGGYRHSPPDKETKTRWFEQTALSTVMQIGDSSSIAPWEFDKGTDYDIEMLNWYRIYVRLHLRLFPYEWTYANNIKKDGRPIQRAMGLAYPELGVHPSDQYMFGDHLLVAPVLKRDARSREVLFPQGRWADWWDGTVYEGGKPATVDAPLGKLPLYIAEGGIVPMLRPTIDSMSPTTEPGLVDSYATTPGVLYPVVFAGAKSEFKLFDGATVTQEK
ncbi:MAG: TIM-barrel domain-containing protein, partial [Myxococcota bacterium]